MSKFIKIASVVLAFTVIIGIYFYKNGVSKQSVDDLKSNSDLSQQQSSEVNNENKDDIDNSVNNSSLGLEDNAVDTTINKVDENISNNSNANIENQNKAGVITNKSLPMLVDLGAGTCIPCKMMAPILEEAQKAYEGKAIVKVIDVNESRDEAMKYGIRVIPTQIFFDADGKEVYRHEGFMPKEDIVSKFKEMGVE